MHALHIQQGQSKAIQTGLRAELQLKTEEVGPYCAESIHCSVIPEVPSITTGSRSSPSIVTCTWHRVVKSS